jgi:D-alanyl-D-alanine carboxypeptidase/D-alanyl-D-alanine-endopeptidase (penicillin-binding protein 4)
MSFSRIVALVLLAFAPPSQGGRMESRIKRLLAQSPAARHGFAGILVVDEKGKRLVSINADRDFVPASNTKLFSTALALERLGPEKRFETRVEQRGKDLALVGTGDANLSGRVLPYTPDSQPGPVLAALDDLAAQVAARGIGQVEGGIVGDDSAFLFEPFAPGWTASDVVDSDGAPVSALVVNDNSVTLRVTPGAGIDLPATVERDPPIPLFQLDAQVNTASTERMETQRLPFSNTWRLRGSVSFGNPPYLEHWAVTDPALFAAMAFQYSLERHGVHVLGEARALHREPGEPFTAPLAGAVLAQHQSLPLIEDLRLIDKVSQNVHADLLLFDLGGSREEGLKILDGFLTEDVGVKPGEYRFYDGSGLSRMNLVTPEVVVALLRYMLHSPHSEEWVSLLPVSGVDGSLRERLTGARVEGRIHAKTGMLNHVSALSGYADARKSRLTFSIFLNNITSSAAEQRELIDKICAVLLQ